MTETARTLRDIPFSQICVSLFTEVLRHLSLRTYFSFCEEPVNSTAFAFLKHQTTVLSDDLRRQSMHSLSETKSDWDRTQKSPYVFDATFG